MTVETTVAKTSALPGNGVTTIFSFSPIVIFVSTDIVVTKTDAAGVETTLAEGTGTTQYSVSVSSYPGTGSIQFPADLAGTKLASGETIVIKRVLPIEQTLDLENQGGYFPENQETALDKGTMVDLQLDELLQRSLLLPITDTGDAPIVARTASQYLRWNTAADAIDAVAITSTSAAASDVTPLGVSLSAAAAGVAGDFSREDHVHLLPTVTVAKGGTGATTAGAARTNLGLVIGTDVYPETAVVSQADAEAGTATDERIWTAQRVQQAIASLSALPRSYGAGCTLSNDAGDTAHDINATAGEWRNADNDGDLALASEMTKQIDASWVAGDDAGGLSSSLTVANNTTYHVFLIEVAGAVDVGIDTSIVAANLIADHSATSYRRIGSRKTDGSANLPVAKQYGDEVWLDVPISDLTNSTISSSGTATTITLSVPTGLSLLALFNASNGTNSTSIFFYETGTTGAKPNNTSVPVGSTGGPGEDTSQVTCRTNTSAQIDGEAGSTATDCSISLLGWVDNRGRDG